MLSDDAVLMIQYQSGRTDFEHEAFAGKSRRRRVAIGIEGNPAAQAHQHGLQHRRLIRFERQSVQGGLFGGEEFLGSLMRLTMHTNIGHFVHPTPSSGVDSFQAGKLQPRQEVLLYVMNGFFHASLFVDFSWPTRLNGKAVVPRKIQVTRMRHRWLAHRVRQNGGLTVVDDYLKDGTDGGMIRVDLGHMTSVQTVNTYSCHPSNRAPQIYTLYASDGEGTRFVLSPQRGSDLERQGWHRIVSVATPQFFSSHAGPRPKCFMWADQANDLRALQIADVQESLIFLRNS